MDTLVLNEMPDCQRVVVPDGQVEQVGRVLASIRRSTKLNRKIRDESGFVDTHVRKQLTKSFHKNVDFFNLEKERKKGRPDFRPVKRRMMSATQRWELFQFQELNRVSSGTKIMAEENAGNSLIMLRDEIRLKTSNIKKIKVINF